MSAPRFAPPPAEVVAANVTAALAEDIGPGDATADLLDDAPDSAYLLCKDDCVVAGRPWFDACHRALDPGVRIDWRCEEGDRIARLLGEIGVTAESPQPSPEVAAFLASEDAMRSAASAAG